MPLCALADLTNQKGFGKQAREQWHAFIPRSSNQFHCYRFRLRFVKRKTRSANTEAGARFAPVNGTGFGDRWIAVVDNCAAES
ncbi:MAG: hypothetical protein DMF16_01100 [Verrucomicrobia bacterium]|nr:MAG: hypothetical protein DMF16_01100 [Verrucomicrobiota bacterium]